MKFLFDLFPVVLFFIFYKIYDIYVATAALMAATYIQIILLYLFKKKIEKMIIFTAIVITVFGGMTLFFKVMFLLCGNHQLSIGFLAW